MALSTKNEELRLQAGPTWKSFERFRQEGSKALESIKNGIVGILHTKTGQYRFIEESDFQKLYGLACEVNRLQGGLKVIISAARAVKKHPDDLDSINVLIESVTVFGNLTALPTRQSFEPLRFEIDELDEDDENDEIITDPEELDRLIKAQSLAQIEK
jgi:hypothetical protein